MQKVNQQKKYDTHKIKRRGKYSNKIHAYHSVWVNIVLLYCILTIFLNINLNRLRKTKSF
jgi:hypothetical protein